MHNRTLAGAVAVTAAGALVWAGDVPSSAVPSAATRIALTAGHTTSGVDAVLRPGASISGIVSSRVTHTGVMAVVTAYLNDKQVASTVSDNAGHYVIGSLLASSTGYVVCTNGDDSTQDGSPTGLLKQCSAAVPLAAGEQKPDVDLAERAGAAIAGRVVAPNGNGVVGVEVRARNLDTGRVFSVGTRTLGHFLLAGLTRSHAGYALCVATSDPEFPGPTGFAPRCDKTPVDVRLGEVHRGVRIRLQRGAAVSGRVLDGTTGDAIDYPLVAVFTAKGRFIEYAEGDATGHYVAKSLPGVRAVRVCAANAYQQGHWLTCECWQDVPWTHAPRLPRGTTGVRVQLGAVHQGINFTLHSARLLVGSISGRVIDRAGHPIEHATVLVYGRYSKPVGDLFTSANGRYHLTIRKYAPGYLVCVQPTPDVATSTVPAPATGWAPRCYGASWDGALRPHVGTRLPVTTTHLHWTDINVVVRTGGAISGTTSVFGGGVPTSTGVYLYNTAGKFIDLTETDPTDGTYGFRGLSASSDDYVVCFTGEVMDQPGYRPQCYNDVPWHGAEWED